MFSSTIYLSGGYAPIEHLGIWGGAAYVWTRWDRNGLLRPDGHRSVPTAPRRRRELARGPSGCSIRGPVQPPRGAASRHPACRDRLSDARLRHGRPRGDGPSPRRGARGALRRAEDRSPSFRRSWAQVRYAYSFVENIKDHDTGDVLNLNRSNLDAEIGYYVSPSFSVRVFGAFQWTVRRPRPRRPRPSPFRRGFRGSRPARLARTSRSSASGPPTRPGRSTSRSSAPSRSAVRTMSRFYTVAATVTWNFGRAPAESFFGTRTRPAPR